MNIYIGNLPKTTNEDAVRKVFEAYGKVREVKLIQDKFTQELRGFGFVEMPSKTEAQEAIKNIDGSELDGRNLIVNEARPREDRSDNKNRRGGGFSSRSW